MSQSDRIKFEMWLKAFYGEIISLPQFYYITLFILLKKFLYKILDIGRCIQRQIERIGKSYLKKDFLVFAGLKDQMGKFCYIFSKSQSLLYLIAS